MRDPARIAAACFLALTVIGAIAATLHRSAAPLPQRSDELARYQAALQSMSDELVPLSQLASRGLGIQKAVDKAESIKKSLRSEGTRLAKVDQYLKPSDNRSPTLKHSVVESVRNGVKENTNAQNEIDGLVGDLKNVSDSLTRVNSGLGEFSRRLAETRESLERSPAPELPASESLSISAVAALVGAAGTISAMILAWRQEGREREKYTRALERQREEIQGLLHRLSDAAGSARATRLL